MSDIAKRILLKSKDATYTSSSAREQYVFSLSNAKLNGRYRVSSVSFCYGWYNVTSANNTVYTSLGNATIPSGYYSAATFTTALQTALQVANAGYTATYNTDTRKLTIANATPFTLNFATTTSTAAYLMGFALSNTGSGTSATGDYPVNLISSPSMLLEFETSIGAIDSCNSAASNRGHVYVPIDQTTYGNYQTLTSDEICQYVEFTQNVSRLVVNVYDNQGNPLNLQRTDFEILLENTQC